MHEECAQGGHGGAWRRTGQIQQDPRGMHAPHLDGYPRPLQQSCMVMHVSTWRPSHQWGLRVAQVTGACDHIRFRERCRARQGTHVRGEVCMGIHGGMEVQRSRHARITGYLTSTAATSDAAPHPCRRFGIQSVCQQQEATWPRVMQNLDHPEYLSCLLRHLVRSSLSEGAVPTLIAGPSSGPDPLCPRFASRSSRSWFEASQVLLKTAFDNCKSNALGESIDPECMAQAQEQDDYQTFRESTKIDQISPSANGWINK